MAAEFTMTFEDSDNAQFDFGFAPTSVGIINAVLNDDYTLTINFSDGTDYTSPPIRGEKGDRGSGITGTVMNPDFTITITFDDGYTYTTLPIRGEKGEKGDTGNTGATGNGISSMVLNNDYTLTVTFTDGETYTSPSIRGEKGEKGDVGRTPVITTDKEGVTTTIFSDGVDIGTIEDGDPGVYVGTTAPTDPDIKVWIKSDGTSDGVSITGARLNSDYTLTVSFSDGTSYTTPPIRGEKGEKGDTGHSGVDISTTAPTDPNINVWIDPTGSGSQGQTSGSPGFVLMEIDGETGYSTLTGTEVLEHLNNKTLIMMKDNYENKYYLITDYQFSSDGTISAIYDSKDNYWVRNHISDRFSIPY